MLVWKLNKAERDKAILETFVKNMFANVEAAEELEPAEDEFNYSNQSVTFPDADPEPVQRQSTRNAVPSRCEFCNATIFVVIGDVMRYKPHKCTAEPAPKPFGRCIKSIFQNQLNAEMRRLDTELADGQKIFVHVFPNGANGKALDAALKHVKKPAAVLAFSINDDIGKVVVLAKVDKTLVSAGFKAPAWIAKVCEVIGGGGGGKDLQAQGVGDCIDKVEEAAEVARKFAEQWADWQIAVDELQESAVPSTEDSYKYNYTEIDAPNGDGCQMFDSGIGYSKPVRASDYMPFVCVNG